MSYRPCLSYRPLLRGDLLQNLLLLVGNFSFANLVRDAQFIRTHIFQFVRFPVPADEYRNLFSTFRVFDFYDFAQITRFL